MKQNNILKDILLNVTIDRPKGYVDAFNNIYPINYGYIEGVIGGDGESQDVYILDDNLQLTENSLYLCKLKAIIIRKNDNETKWVAANKDISFDDIKQQTYFIEQYFSSEIIIL